MKYLLRIIDNINIGVGKGASFLLVIIAGVIVYEVIARAFFGKPTIWAHETSGMLFGVMFMLGAGYVLYRKAHVKVDILTARLSPRIQAALDIITHLVFAFYLWAVIKFGWIYALRAFTRMEVTNSSWAPLTFPIKFVIVIGASILLLQLAAKYIRDIYKLFTARELE